MISGTKDKDLSFVENIQPPILEHMYRCNAVLIRQESASELNDDPHIINRIIPVIGTTGYGQL